MNSLIAVAGVASVGILVSGHARERTDVRLDNNRFSPSLITVRVGDTPIAGC